MNTGLSKIADSIENRGVISSNHRFIAFGAYGMLMVSLTMIELVIISRSGVMGRHAVTATLLLLSVQQVYAMYLRPGDEDQTTNLSKSLKFSQYATALWVATLYPWPHADLNIAMMAILVFQLSIFVSLARFFVEQIRSALLFMSALILCLHTAAPSVLSAAMFTCSTGYLLVLWVRLDLNQKSYRRVLDLGLSSEESNRALREQQTLLFKEARTDQMTRIGNRRAYYEYCDEIGTLTSTFTVVAILDLDGFKQINDLHGHEAGDTMICETATRLKNALSPNGRVFRIGGDEFAIVYQGEDVFPTEKLRSAAQNALKTPVSFEGKVLKIQWSMGMVEIDAQTAKFGSALAKADKALYKAKAVKSSHSHLYTAQDDAEMRDEAVLLAHAHCVLTDGAIEMHGQPIYDIEADEQKLYAVEALIRIKGPEGKPIRPDIFVEKANLVRETSNLTLWSLRKSVRLLEQAPPDALLTFNLSPEQFVDERLCEVLATALAPSQFDPQRLVIELSEKTLLSDINRTKRSLDTLKKFGVKVALDDFGSENTGFSTLIDFDVDIIKTDPMLLMSALTNKRSAVMFQKTMELCEALNIVCIAEGVETLREFDFAKRAGCRFFQGYHFGRPALNPEFQIITEERTMLDPVLPKVG